MRKGNERTNEHKGEQKAKKLEEQTARRRPPLLRAPRMYFIYERTYGNRRLHILSFFLYKLLLRLLQRGKERNASTIATETACSVFKDKYSTACFLLLLWTRWILSARPLLRVFFRGAARC